jgi:acetyltransferase-like isoleucine patch superfamily enzyme
MTAREQFDRLRTAIWLRACSRVGTNQYFHGRPSVNVYGGAISIGSRCTISSRPVRSHFVAGPGAALEIGDDVSIGHGAAVAAFEMVQIGARTRIGPFVIIMDTNFHGSPGDQSVQHDCRPVIIGRDCRIGSRVTITRGASIGEGAEILAGSVVSTTIPAGACAAGARARVIGRAGQADSRWESAAAMLPWVLKDALQLSTLPDPDVAVSELVDLHDPAFRHLLSVIDEQFNIRLGDSGVNHHTRLADIAVLVELSRREEGGSDRA